MAFNLLLKWGSIKGWDGATDKAMDLLDKWEQIGVSASAAMQEDTPEQKDIICKVIDLVDGEIKNDWSGDILSKDQAKNYILEYGKQ
jgi:hypothetical protein